MTQALKKLNQIVKDLPEDKKKEVIQFAEYLHYQQVEKQGLTAQISEGIKEVKAGKFRSAKDLIKYEI